MTADCSIKKSLQRGEGPYMTILMGWGTTATLAEKSMPGD